MEGTRQRHAGGKSRGGGGGGQDNMNMGGSSGGGGTDTMHHMMDSARDSASHLAASLKENPTLNQGKQQILSAYNKVCDSCGQLQRQYPSMTIGLLVLTAFCIGMAIPMTMHYFSPTARFQREHSEAHAALDQVLSKYYDLKSKTEGVTEPVKGKVQDVLAGADDLKMKAAKKVAESYLSAKLASEAAQKGAAHLGNSMLDSLMGAKDSVVDTASDLADKVLHRQKKETGLKGKLHEAEDKLADLLHSAADKLHA